MRTHGGRGTPEAPGTAPAHRKGSCFIKHPSQKSTHRASSCPIKHPNSQKSAKTARSTDGEDACLARMLSLWGAERAFLLRRQLSKLHRPNQFAALVAGTGLNIVVTDAARTLAATEKPPHELSSLLMAKPLLRDVALGVGTSKRLRSHQKPEHHCEALLCTRLEAEPPGVLEALSPPPRSSS